MKEMAPVLEKEMAHKETAFQHLNSGERKSCRKIGRQTRDHEGFLRAWPLGLSYAFRSVSVNVYCIRTTMTAAGSKISRSAQVSTPTPSRCP